MRTPLLPSPLCLTDKNEKIKLQKKILFWGPPFRERPPTVRWDIQVKVSNV